MHSRHSFDSIKTIKLKIAPSESFSERTITGIKFVRHLIIDGYLATYKN